MNENLGRQDEVSQRAAALIAGLSLLLMAVLAPIAFFGVFGSVVDWKDAEATVANILASQGLFRASIGAFLLVIVLDVLVAWALYYLLKPVNNSLSGLAACFRLVYTAGYLVAVSHLFNTVELLTDRSEAVQASTAEIEARTMESLVAFANGWGLSLAVFGVHLLLLGWLVFRSGFIPRTIGVLVCVAGAGYLINSLGKILVPGFSVGLIQLTFLGELLLMGWLLWIGFRRPTPR